MRGLEAINAANGWAMALAGMSIVLSGLFVLSMIISQLHRILGWVERLKTPPPAEPADPPGAEETFDIHRALAIPDHMPEDLAAVAGIYKALTDGLAAPFELKRLYAIGAQYHLPHVHLSVRALRDAGHLVCVGDGLFTWLP